MTINTNSTNRKKILIVSISNYDSLTNVNMNKYLLLKENYFGDLLGVTCNKEYVDKDIDGFKMKVTFLSKKWMSVKLVKYIIFFFNSLYQCLFSHYREGNYDIIIAREPQLAGPMAFIISKLTRTKLIVELNGNYANPCIWEDISNAWLRKLKKGLSSRIIPFVLTKAHGIKLLYPAQADFYLDKDTLSNKVVSTFHEYTPISLFKPVDDEQKILLSMGFPYRVKGFDIAIQSFLKIAHKIPDFELHLVGFLWPNERDLLKNMIGGNKQIKLLKPLEYPSAMKKVSECSIFLLASRTEAMGRVLLEAMAHKKPLIGSSVDGIPTYIRDGFNGLVFKSECVDDLAAKILLLSEDYNMREMFATNGLQYVTEELSEESYLKKYHCLIQEVLT